MLGTVTDVYTALRSSSSDRLPPSGGPATGRLEMPVLYRSTLFHSVAGRLELTRTGWWARAGPRRTARDGPGPRAQGAGATGHSIGWCSRPFCFICGKSRVCQAGAIDRSACVRTGARLLKRGDGAVSFSTGAWLASRTSGVSKPATALRAGEAPSMRQCEGWRAWLLLHKLELTAVSSSRPGHESAGRTAAGHAHSDLVSALGPPDLHGQGGERGHRDALRSTRRCVLPSQPPSRDCATRVLTPGL